MPNHPPKHCVPPSPSLHPTHMPPPRCFRPLCVLFCASMLARNTTSSQVSPPNHHKTHTNIMQGRLCSLRVRVERMLCTTTTRHHRASSLVLLTRAWRPLSRRPLPHPRRPGRRVASAARAAPSCFLPPLSSRLGKKTTRHKQQHPAQLFASCIVFFLPPTHPCPSSCSFLRVPPPPIPPDLVLSRVNPFETHIHTHVPSCHRSPPFSVSVSRRGCFTSSCFLAWEQATGARRETHAGRSPGLSAARAHRVASCSALWVALSGAASNATRSRSPTFSGRYT